MSRIAFMHIPKTGGISLERAIERALGPNLSVCPLYFPKEYSEKRYPDVSGYDFYKGHFNFDFLETVPNEYFKITVVRDPLDLILSLYNHILTRPRHRIYEDAQKMDLISLIEKNPGMHNLLSKYILGAKGFEFVRRPSERSGDTLESIWRKAREHLGTFDYIGFTTHLGDVTNFLSAEVGHKIGAPLRENASLAGIRDRESLSARELAVLENVSSLDRFIFERLKDSANGLLPLSPNL